MLKMWLLGTVMMCPVWWRCRGHNDDVMSLHRTGNNCESCMLSSSLNSVWLEQGLELVWIHSSPLHPICHLFLLIKNSLSSIYHFLFNHRSINVHCKIPCRRFQGGLAFNGHTHCLVSILHSSNSGKTVSMLLNLKLKVHVLQLGRPCYTMSHGAVNDPWAALHVSADYLLNTFSRP